MRKEFFDDAVCDLREFKGITEKRNGQVELRDKWNQDPETFALNSDEFYANKAGDSYLYDLAYWHASKTIFAWGKLVEQYAVGRVWDFGAGIGTYSLIAASSPEVDVVYYDDINPENREFAHWRFDKYGVLDKVKFGHPSVKVESIIALDVIEHLTDPYKQILVFHLYSTPGATLTINVTSHNSGGEHPMHIMDASGVQKFWSILSESWKKIDGGSPSVWRKR